MTRGPLPDGLVPSGNSLEFTDADMPNALLREHALGPGHWGRLHVMEGSITFVDMGTNEEVSVSAGESVPIHSQAPHRLIVSGPVRVRIDFFVEGNAA